MKHLALSLLLCVSTASLHSMTQWQFDREKESKEVILATPTQELTEDQLLQIKVAFTGENYRTYTWFVCHARFVEPYIQATISDAKLKITGSREWGTNHLLSDIDAVVVTAETDPEKVVGVLATYYTAHYPHVTQLRKKIKAGLSLFTLKDFSDPQLGSMKLEYTVQNPEMYTTILTGMREKLKTQFANDCEKIRYACAIMVAMHNNDETTQKKLKQWTNILPAKQ